MPKANNANSSLKWDRTNSKKPRVAGSGAKGERPRRVSPYTNKTKSVHANPCDGETESMYTKSRTGGDEANLVTP